MKKLIVLFVLGMCLVGCANSTKKVVVNNDSTAIDSAKVDSTVVDSTIIDTITIR